MKADRRTAANRRNALRSTGPRTPEGKARSSGNALRHGLLAGAVVLPEVERAEEWEAHRDATIEALAPVGRVEELLAERVAVQSWRLGRVVRFEREAAALLQEDAEDDVTRYADSRRPFDEVIGDAKWHEPAQAGLFRLAFGPGGALSEDEGDGALVLIACAARDRGAKPPDTDDVLDELDPERAESWSVHFLARSVDLLLQKAGVDPSERPKLIEAAIVRAALVLAEARELRRGLGHIRRRRLLPDEETLEKVARYESHLERSLFKTLHELERRQAARRGTAVPVPEAVDVTLDVRRP